ncbi:hypothetical protein Poli38472_014355 [Pythium oligandrum]|uniref:Uncharacterized protein n=1 Tax=Pythium oligandrum TaxID=41045 RepID=A0A8K1FFK5_PYTOL|nr:hypothetical protein Poli38472_014355 [Pythium oligandrum]|eukprot:TMW57752.1 hypothetical protein Poli38472_014355 [Pythium oligandrum]
MRAFYYELVSHDGKHRKNLLFEIIEVVIQTITLHELLSDGLHQSLIILYVSLMVINCVCCFYHITCAWKQHAYDKLVTDAMLDIVFAVVFPAVVLVQAVRAYRTDLRAMQIRQKFFPAQPYGRRARIYSDPGQINSFTAAFDNLRITSPLDVVAKIGFNLLTCLRWRRIALTLRAKRRKDNTGAQNAPNKGKNHGIGPVIPNLSPCKDNLEVQVSYRPIPSYVGILFLLYGALAATYTYGALSMSNLACAPYATTCVLYAYQWSPSGEASLCPCLVFIERDMSPSIRTWLSLSDLSQNLSLLAEAGMLRTVQVMNRGMNYALPKHLMQCSDIRHLILINTDVEELPEWMVYAFPKLEYLHIEGQPRGNCITSLPDKLFSGMPTLRTLSLSRHRVFTVPPFDGLVSLRTMYLGDVPFIPELPPLEPLHHLQTLGLVQIRNLAYLPELSSLAPTLRSVYIQYAPLCCSGFLSEGNTSYPGCSTYHSRECCASALTCSGGRVPPPLQADFSAEELDFFRQVLPQPISQDAPARVELRVPLHIACQMKGFPHLQRFLDQKLDKHIPWLTVHSFAQPPHILIYDRHDAVVDTIPIASAWTPYQLRDLMEDAMRK